VTRGLSSLVAAMLCAGSAGAEQLPAPPVEPKSGISLAIATPFHEPPASGALPLSVTIRNDSLRDGQWRLALEATGSWGQRTYGLVEELPVPAGEERRFELAAQLGAREAIPWVMVQVRILGPGVGPQDIVLYHRHVAAPSRSGATGTVSAPVALSESLALRHEATLTAELQDSNVALFASRFEPGQLPGDWRSYTGFARVAMTALEHRGAPAAAQAALRRWMARGGELLLLSGGGERTERIGFGRLLVRPARDDSEARTALLDGLEGPASRSPFPTGSYVPGALAHDVRLPELPDGMLVFFVLGVAAVAGPVNLFWFCRGRRRQRLFWTTPVVSVAASAVLLAMILAVDGTGGSGARWTAIVLQEDAHGAVVVQEQVARTGFLLGSAFELEAGASMERLDTPAPGFQGAPQRLDRSGNRHSGGWFRSRAIQSHLVEAARPSRLRVELAGGSPGTPLIVSSIPATLDTLFWLDDDGDWWTGEGVEVGVPSRLAPSDESEFGRWLQQQSGRAGTKGLALLSQLDPTPGDFFAACTEARLGIETLPTVEWRQASVWITGRVL